MMQSATEAKVRSDRELCGTVWWLLVGWPIVKLSEIHGRMIDRKMSRHLS